MQNLLRKSGMDTRMVRRMRQFEKLQKSCRKKICDHHYHSGLQRTLKPVLTALQLLGLYYSSHCSDGWRRYGIIVFLGLSVSFIHSLTVFDANEVYGSILFGKIQWSLLCFESMLLPLMFLRGFRRGGPLELFFIRWDETVVNESANRSNKRVVIAGLVLLLLTVSINFFGLLVSFYIEPNVGEIIAEITWARKRRNTSLAINDGGMFHINTQCNFSCQKERNFSSGSPQGLDPNGEHFANTFQKGYIISLITLNMAVISASVSLLVVLCILIVRQFDKLADRLTEAITPQGRLLCDLGQLRYEHERLIQLVETLDCGFSPVIALTFLTNIVIFTLNFYNLLYFQKESGYHTILFSIWFVTIVSQLTFISTAAACVNSSVHRLLPYLYRIRSCDHTRDYQMEMLLFLSVLTGRQIGLSALRMFVVTWKTILTVVGLLITYFVLLIQFRGTNNNTGTSDDRIKLE